jgi:hypothetical protein
MFDSPDYLDLPPEPTKKDLPNAWKAGRKKDPNSKKAQRYGTDETLLGGKLQLKADAKVAVAERDDPAYTRFSEIVGGKEGLRELAAWSENPKAQKLFQILDDGRFKTYGIKALAKRCGMTLPELCNLFREKHFLEMYFTFFAGVPEIAEGAVHDAKPSTDVCPRCDGEGIISNKEGNKECPKCLGAKRIRVAGDKEARRDVFKAVGVIKESPAVVTNVTVAGVDNFEDLMRATKIVPVTRRIENVKEVQEAEVVQD